jgi:glutamate N-acetyltransferase/amino-acid N-acetyltransferase
MKSRELDIRIDVGIGGPGRAVLWTCDLTQAYVAINAGYRS